MPRLRRPEAAPMSGDIPGPLYTRLDPLWRDPDAVLRFAADLGLRAFDAGRVSRGPLAAFEAVSNAYVKQQGVNPGVPTIGFGLVARQRHGMLGRDVTDAEWAQIADMERRFHEERNA